MQSDQLDHVRRSFYFSNVSKYAGYITANVYVYAGEDDQGKYVLVKPAAYYTSG